MSIYEEESENTRCPKQECGLLNTAKRQKTLLLFCSKDPKVQCNAAALWPFDIYTKIFLKYYMSLLCCDLCQMSKSELTTLGLLCSEQRKISISRGEVIRPTLQCSSSKMNHPLEMLLCFSLLPIEDSQRAQLRTRCPTFTCIVWGQLIPLTVCNLNTEGHCIREELGVR